MLNVFIAILESKKVISSKEAAKLADKLRFATLSDNYKDAVRLVESILK